MLLIVLLIIVIVFEILDIRSQRKKLSQAKSMMPGTASYDPTSLRKAVVEHEKCVDRLEILALWSSEQDFVSWLTIQADDSGVQIVGLEYLPVYNKPQYRQVSVMVTLRGTYNPLGRFINRLERSSNMIKIDSLNALCKDSTPDQITMSLWLSYFQKANEL